MFALQGHLVFLVVLALASPIQGQAFSFTLPPVVKYVNQMGMDVGAMTGQLVIPQNGVNCNYKGLDTMPLPAFAHTSQVTTTTFLTVRTTLLISIGKPLASSALVLQPSKLLGSNTTGTQWVKRP